MSNVQFAINSEMLKNMQLTHGQFTLGSLLVKVGLAFPEVDGKRNRKNVGSGKLATKESKNESILNLKKDAMLEFTFEVIAPIIYTSFKHELLAKQNESAQEFSDKMRIFANMSTIELERDTFLGETLPAKEIHALIKTFVSQSKNATKIGQNWRKNKGAYLVKRNGEFVPYAAPAKQASKPESENLAPAIVPNTYITDIAIAEAQARKENQAREKLAKQESAKLAMQKA